MLRALLLLLCISASWCSDVAVVTLGPVGGGGGGGGGGVSTLNSLTGAVNIQGSASVTVTPSGQNLVLTAAGIGSSTFLDNAFAVQNSADATKQFEFLLSSMTTGKVITIKPLSTTSQILQIPNITATDTIATLGLANTFTSPITVSAASSIGNFTANAAAAGTQSGVLFQDGGVSKWSLHKETDNSFGIYDSVGNVDQVHVYSGSGVTGSVSITGELLSSASTTGRSGLNVAPGTAPTSAVNGDLWDTSAGFYGQVNGVTVGPFATQPMTALGDIVYGGASGVPTRLPGNTTTARQFYSSTGTGSVSAAPALGVLLTSDLPAIPGSAITSGVVGTTYGGTGLNSAAAANGATLIGTGSGLALGVPTGTAPIVVTTGPGTLNVSLGTTPPANGGTGLATLTAYAPIFAGTTATGNFQQAALGSAGTVLTSNGPGAIATFQPPSGGVASLNSLTGALSIAAGTGITVTPSGSSITIAATGGGGGATTFADNVFAVQNASDATKQLEVSLGGMTAGTALTLVGNQTASANLTIPNIVSAGDTVATLKQGNAFVGANTFGSVTSPVAITQAAATSGNPPTGFSYVGGAHTGLNTGVATPAEVLFNGNQTKQWTGTSSVTSYRFFEIDGPVMAATASTTFISPSTFYIAGPPTTGANATVSAPYALNVHSGNMLLAGGTFTMTNAGANVLISPAASSTTASTIVTVNSATMSNITAGSEVTDVNFNLTHTINHATGAITQDRTVIFNAPTHTAAGASTISTADTVNIVGAPIASTNVTITTANALHVAGGRSQFDGDVSLGVIGARLKITTGSNASAGTATLSSGAVTVSNTLVTANTMVFVTCQALGTVVVPSGFSVTRTAGTSFTITASQATDTSTVAWFFVEPGP